MREDNPVEAKELTKLAVKALEDKGEDIRVITHGYLYWLITLSSQTEATPAR